MCSWSWLGDGKRMSQEEIGDRFLPRGTEMN